MRVKLSSRAGAIGVGADSEKPVERETFDSGSSCLLLMSASFERIVDLAGAAVAVECKGCMRDELG